MKALKFLVICFLLLACSTSSSHARAVQVLDMKSLMKDSALVFVGRIKSVAPSGMTTALFYPTWEDSTFEWLKVEVEVIEPIKGTRKETVVHTLMLSAQGIGPIVNPPGMVRPEVGQCHLLCLLPTTIEGTYASLAAPFDDREGIFLLNRKLWSADGSHYYNDEGKEVAFREQSEKNLMLWNLVDGRGAILPDGAEALRKAYRTEIVTPAAKDAVIHLKWKREKGKGGWQWNVPDEKDANKKQGKSPVSKR